MKRYLAAFLLLTTTIAFSPAPVRAEDNVALVAADVNIASSGDNTVIASQSGKCLEVYKFWVVSEGAVNLKFKDGATALNATAVHLTADGSSMFFPVDGKSYWGTSQGNAFIINLSGAVQVSGRIYYAVRSC